MENTLIIASAYSGHILEITPLIRSAAKEGDVSIVIHPRQHIYLDQNKNVSRIYDQNDDNTESLATFLYSQPFTRIINLQDNRFSKEVMEGFPHIIKEKGFISMLISSLLPKVTGQALLNKQMKAYKLNDDGLGLDYQIGESDGIKADDLPTSHHAGFYTVIVDRELAEAVNLTEAIGEVEHPVVLMSDAAAIPLAAKIENGDNKIYNAAGKFSLNEMADIIRQSKVVVTGHNDFLFLALANNRKVIYLSNPGVGDIKPEKLYAKSFSEQKNGNFFKRLPNLSSAKTTTELSRFISELL